MPRIGMEKDHHSRPRVVPRGEPVQAHHDNYCVQMGCGVGYVTPAAVAVLGARVVDLAAAATAYVENSSLFIVGLSVTYALYATVMLSLQFGWTINRLNPSASTYYVLGRGPRFVRKWVSWLGLLLVSFCVIGYVVEEDKPYTLLSFAGIVLSVMMRACEKRPCYETTKGLHGYCRRLWRAIPQSLELVASVALMIVLTEEGFSVGLALAIVDFMWETMEFLGGWKVLSGKKALVYREADGDGEYNLSILTDEAMRSFALAINHHTESDLTFSFVLDPLDSTGGARRFAAWLDYASPKRGGRWAGLLGQPSEENGVCLYLTPGRFSSKLTKTKDDGMIHFELDGVKMKCDEFGNALALDPEIDTGTDPNGTPLADQEVRLT